MLRTRYKATSELLDRSLRRLSPAIVAVCYLVFAAGWLFILLDFLARTFFPAAPV